MKSLFLSISHKIVPVLCSAVFYLCTAVFGMSNGGDFYRIFSQASNRVSGSLDLSFALVA